MGSRHDRDPNSLPSEAGGSSQRYFDPQQSSSSQQPRHNAARPGYMTVGTGSISESAGQLAAMLDHDSGYGGSIDAGNVGQGWHPGLTEDAPVPSPPPGISTGDSSYAEHERRTVASHVLQLYYNQNRTALGRSINSTIDTLRKFQEFNQKWPAHYPQMQPETSPQRNEPRPGIHHTQSSLDSRLKAEHASPASPDRPKPLRRAGTSLGEASTHAESSSAAAEKPPEAPPRLVSAQLSHDYSVLKLELKMHGRNQADLVHSLEKSSVAALLDGQIQQSIRHLGSLRERIDDTASKVLITGDLNAGKSTFCNALLRRKVLPEDQQPCTSIFCEVWDCRENGGLEEVHAVPIGSVYDRNDESTYKVFSLSQLEDVVIDNESFSLCKIYIKDRRSVDESLLNNGVVDITLIDAPGLNNDSLKTTAVFARQEEIDVVIFVVSAANHFTQSAKEFIFNAAREKAYMFMVVNGFDNIRDQRRCQEMILKQVNHLSPATFKESSELVHFVSSNAIPVNGPPGPPGAPGGPGGSGSGSGSSSGLGDGNDFPTPDNDDGKHGEPGDSDKGKGKEREKMRDFAELEASLRRFVLEKRARSKLAPAKTYLMNLLADLNNLAGVNRDVAQGEFDRVRKELEELEPAYEQSKKSRTQAGEELDRNIENSTLETYNHTRGIIDDAIDRVAERDLGIPYPGLWDVYQYADDIKDAMLLEIQDTVSLCEEHARNKAIQGFNGIKNLGILHVGNAYPNVIFHSEKMFMKSRHTLARQLDLDIELLDFFDFTSLWERQEKFAGTSMALTVAGVVGGRLVGGVSWVDSALAVVKVTGVRNLKWVVIPALIGAGAVAVQYALNAIPQSLPRRLSHKLSTQLAALDYTHTNASRISGEVRRALKQPTNELRVELQRSVEKLQSKKEETSKVRTEAEAARKYFGNLVRNSADIRQGVDRVDLEGPPPGMAAQYAH